MYRTDKQFMKNPATASSRIYVGNLAETVRGENLEEHFATHGRILGLVVQRGFSFIQFENEEQALNAIQREHGVLFFGKHLNVKRAIDNASKLKQNQNQRNIKPNQNSQQPQLNQPQMQQQQQLQQNTNNMNPQQQSTLNLNTPQVIHNHPLNSYGNNQNETFNTASLMNQTTNMSNLEINTNDGFHKNEQSCKPSPGKPPSIQGQIISPLKPQQISPHAPNVSMPKSIDNNQTNKNDEFKDKRRRRNRGGANREFRDEYMDDSQGMFFDSSYGNVGPGVAPIIGPSSMHGHSLPSIHGPDAGYIGGQSMERERNDCEIIVVSKALTEYAEYIEQRLKDLGLIVDLLFPNDDVPIGRVLANISSRGCLYAILIMPQNEDHRSLTLNVLHGIPEEHRNMPIDDALLFITRNFDAYMRGEKGFDSKDKMTVSSRHPEHIQTIINLLAENRQLSSNYYEKLILYLQEKRELQLKFEIAEGLDTRLEPEVKTKQAELQNRIMSILNKKTEDTVPQVEVQEVLPKADAPPLLADPSVQKALDSLLLGDMFKKIIS